MNDFISQTATLLLTSIDAARADKFLCFVKSAYFSDSKVDAVSSLEPFLELLELKNDSSLEPAFLEG